ncbi:MAG TPA: dihydrodipicolinate synthase family protein, partial [Rubrobacter sp.]|nr:dihydrodipicolinate synthase family protein [Rubrobacter sp.]
EDLTGGARMQGIEGVYVANVTPFRDDGSLAVDAEAYLDHVSWLAEMGVQGVVPFGTNGEGPSVTLGEKLQVLEALFERGFRTQIIPSVMQNNLPETLEMLRALEDYPATAVLILPPYYFKPVEPEGMVRFYEMVLGATSHPVIVYHIPKYAVPVPAEVVIELPVWGVKDSGGEEGYAEAVLAGNKGVLLGTEDDLWRRLGTGAPGVISALANFIPEAVIELYRKHKEGDETGSEALSVKLQKARAMTKEYASPAVLKKLAEARHGAQMGTVRPPFVPVPADYDPGPALEAARAGS